MREALGESDEVKNVDEKDWAKFSRSGSSSSAATPTDAAAYEGIKTKLDEIEADLQDDGAQPLLLSRGAAERVRADRASCCRRAGSCRASTTTQRGHGRASSWRSRSAGASRPRDALNALVLSLFAEHQVYRIDHFLGKETVQNVLVLRFANSIFEPLWNRRWVSHVQITAAETVGVEARGKYYEEAGVVRDMFQNHLLQLLALTGDGAAGGDDGGRRARREGEGAALDPVADAGDDPDERGARAVRARES